jgi:hypothetical protein
MFMIGSVACSQALTTINSANSFAYGANIGWIDWRGDINNGAIIGDYVCSGYLWAANVGWISLGNGAPANQVHYGNLSANDFGVNHDGKGNLSGYAYGANIGWINFEANGAPKVDLKTGQLSGFIYSANCGWISLCNAFACVQTDVIVPGVIAPNGLPIAWLLTHFGTTDVNVDDDPDSDGASNANECLAGTDPLNADDKLVVTEITKGSDWATVAWRTTPERCYYIQKSASLTNPQWLDSGLGCITPEGQGTSTTRTFAEPDESMRFYRVQVVRPLAP